MKTHNEWAELVSALLYMHHNGLTEDEAIRKLGYDPEARAREWLIGPVVECAPADIGAGIDMVAFRKLDLKAK
jgi:hypothetical protein